MKLTTLLFALFFTCFISQISCSQNEQIIQYAQLWKTEHIDTLSVQDTSIITCMLLLSYDVVRSAIVLAHSKLVIQKELLKITTLDIGSTLQTKDLVKQNNTIPMRQAITDLEFAQQSMQETFTQFEKFFPLLINVNAEVTKIFIKNIKQAVFDWAKQQTDIIEEFNTVKKEFIADAQLVTRITNLFDAIIHNIPSERNQLLDGATSVTDMYKKVETTLFQFTKARLKSVEKLEELLIYFFKEHYSVLYAILQKEGIEKIALENNSPLDLPHPDSHFVLLTH